MLYIRKLAPLAFTALLLTLNTACTTTQTVRASQQALAKENIQVGDKVTLYYADGRSEHMRLTRIDSSELTGATPDGSPVVVTYAQLVSVQHKTFAVGKTVGLVLGVAAVGAAMAGAAAAEILDASY